MTDVTLPAEIDAAIDNRLTAHAIAKAGGHNGYVVQGVDLAGLEPAIDTGGVNSFAHQSSSGLNFTIAGGEAFCYGWLCRDRPTTVTVPASTTSTVCVGYDPDAILGASEAASDNENIVVDIESNFVAGQPYLPLYDVTTSSSSISSHTSVRPMGPSQANSDMFASAGDHDSLESSYNSFRNAGGAIGGAISVDGDITVLGDEVIITDVDGNAGFQLPPGVAFSRYQNWTTIYSYSGEGVEGIRFRNPNSGGDMFTVASATGDGWIRGDFNTGGDLKQDGRDAAVSPDKRYVIRKNGTDGSGIINFKT